MSIKYLAIDNDIKLAATEAAVWASRQVGVDRVDNMNEGIQSLLTKKDYLYVGINSDGVDFMPMLSMMRSVTNIPILIATGDYTFNKEKNAREAGADLFAPLQKSTEGNIEAVMMHITWMHKRFAMTMPSPGMLMYKDLLISPEYRFVFIGEKKIALTRQEFDLLHFLTENYGKALSYDNIYENVWGSLYDDASPETLRNAIKRLRKQLKEGSDKNHEYIENVRDFGYRFIGW